MKKSARLIASFLVAAILLDHSAAIAHANEEPLRLSSPCAPWTGSQALAQTTLVAGQVMIGKARVMIVQAMHGFVAPRRLPRLAPAPLLLSGLFFLASTLARAAELPYTVASAVLKQVPGDKSVRVIEVVSEEVIKIGEHGNVWESFRAVQGTTNATWAQYQAYQSHIHNLWKVQATDILKTPGTRIVQQLKVAEPGSVDLSGVHEQPLWGWLNDSVPGIQGWTPEHLAFAAVAVVITALLLWIAYRRYQRARLAENIQAAFVAIRAEMRGENPDLKALEARLLALKTSVAQLKGEVQDELTRRGNAILLLLQNKSASALANVSTSENNPSESRPVVARRPASVSLRETVSPPLPAPAAPSVSQEEVVHYSDEATALNAQMAAVRKELRDDQADLMAISLRLDHIRDAIKTLTKANERQELTARHTIISQSVLKARKKAAEAPLDVTPAEVPVEAGPVVSQAARQGQRGSSLVETVIFVSGLTVLARLYWIFTHATPTAVTTVGWFTILGVLAGLMWWSRQPRSMPPLVRHSFRQAA